MSKGKKRERKYQPGITLDERGVDFGVGEPELEVVIASEVYADGSQQMIQIHPWTRENPSVFVRLGYVDAEGYDLQANKKNGKPHEWTQLEIFNREDFVEAILAVFPELKRAE